MNKKIFVILVLLSIVGIVFWSSLSSKKNLESPELPDEVSQVDEDISPELSGKDLLSDKFEESTKDEALVEEMIRDVSDTQEQSIFPDYDPLNDPRDPLRYKLENYQKPLRYPNTLQNVPGGIPPYTSPTSPLSNTFYKAPQPIKPYVLPHDPLKYRLNQ